jgi:hypothetical protein
LLEADSVEGLEQATRRTVLPGDEAHAVKDPVIVHAGGVWHLWASVHPLDIPAHAVRAGRGRHVVRRVDGALPRHLYDLAVQRRIRALLPDVRLIAALRDPVERAHSNLAHLRGADLEPEPDFGTALALEAGRIADGWAQFWHYAAAGRYGEQLDHLFRSGGADLPVPSRYQRAVSVQAGRHRMNLGMSTTALRLITAVTAR